MPIQCSRLKICCGEATQNGYIICQMVLSGGREPVANMSQFSNNEMFGWVGRDDPMFQETAISADRGPSKG